MNFLFEFLKQEIPRSGKEMPAYYRRALLISEALLTVYFFISVLMLIPATGSIQWTAVVILAGSVMSLLSIDKMSARLNLVAVSTIIVVWLGWFVYTFGWAAGSPNILVPILALAFFNLYVPPLGKIVYFLGIIAFRVVLFAFSLSHTPPGELSRGINIALQIINSVMPLLILVIEYILFSSSIQESERQLTINNQALHKEAGTDPLTGLPNRRALTDVIEDFMRENPQSNFTLAIADIDFFKRVNDSYGHSCGDYTLRELSKLFLSFAEGRYSVGRWGGEEFCFFLPELNLDHAGVIMHDLHCAVEKMPLHFEDRDFSITITIGVEEYDYKSKIDEILDRADRKLYMGKVHGRNQVVI